MNSFYSLIHLKPSLDCKLFRTRTMLFALYLCTKGTERHSNKLGSESIAITQRHNNIRSVLQLPRLAGWFFLPLNHAVLGESFTPSRASQESCCRTLNAGN